jgi:hypothetical protein
MDGEDENRSGNHTETRRHCSGKTDGDNDEYFTAGSICYSALCFTVIKRIDNAYSHSP